MLTSVNTNVIICGMDWKIIIAQVQAKSGLTQPQLAQLLGCSQAHISDLARGRQREPRYSLGLRLLELSNGGASTRKTRNKRLAEEV